MENPPRILSAAAPLAPDGLWSLASGVLACLDPGAGDAGGAAPVVLVPTEDVTVLAVALPPLPSRQRRIAALPFAIEDRIAEPLDRVHVALGAQVGDNLWLVGVVRHSVMRGWLAMLAAADFESPRLIRASLVPDALALPLPEPGGWAVDLAGGRALVRAADGTGFALPLALLDAAWRGAGQPACIACGEGLPGGFAGGDAADFTRGSEPTTASLAVLPLDLRQGPYARPRAPVDPLWKRIATITAIGALAHGVIAVADTAVLSHLAANRAAQVRAEAALARPPVPIGDDLDATLAELTPQNDAQSSPFLRLLSRTGAALTGLPQPPVWRSVVFDRNADTLTLEVETPDLPGLQAVAQGFARAGLAVQPGAAAMDQGKAVGTFTVRGS